MKKINIAIDGPSGVGKSSVAKEIAKRLDLVFINTGLMYRAIGYYCLNHNIFSFSLSFQSSPNVGSDECCNTKLLYSDVIPS